MRVATLVVSAALLLWACWGSPDPYVSLRTERRGAATHLTLIPARGARINARLKPALETPEGTVVRFDSPHLTPDSSYFTAPPEALASAPAVGVIHASVCPEGEAVCRVVEVRSEK